MKHGDDIVAWTGNGLAAVFTALQSEQVFQIVSLVLTIIATTVTILIKLIPLIIRFFRWLKESLADGKIDEEEWKEGEKIAGEISSHIEDMRK